ncbi:Thioredoxin-like fold [Pseudocohnilembus persalinus]|uniref:Thioredoxin-like fold n=1 Tax=Pseudocohnilembus persalinus TaxID=266149 RepID=A0A0V0QW69_PSEPJ|nr:Thioredoxin-like fold [Pseudocohnilembus persalinus]|eukprot:KRX06256.1 Thioredoxin-like fold [Pseudocohnilembus persalinus]
MNKSASENKGYINQTKMIEIKCSEEWDKQVLQSEIPVILLGYEHGCQECRELEKKLVQRAADAVGNYKLVKLNLEENQNIAQYLYMKITPTIYLITGEFAIEGIEGQPGEEKLEKFFESVNRVSGIMDKDTDFLSQIELASVFLEEGRKVDEAIKILHDNLANDIFGKKFGGYIHALIGLGHMLRGESFQCLKHLDYATRQYPDQINHQKTQQIVQKCHEKLKEFQKMQQKYDD